MRRLSLIAAIAAAAMALYAGSAAAATIVVGNNFFSPTGKTVGAGTKVKFKWLGGRRHHIVKTSGPGGAIESGTVGKRGVHLAKRLSRRGTYHFICTIHPTEMRLTIKVR